MSVAAVPVPERRPIDLPFLVLAALFLGALVVCNLIASKFVVVDLGFRTFSVSAGVLPYPLTFLVTDLLSEVYGKRRANAVVWSGFAASLLVLLSLWLGDQFHATADSPIQDEGYRSVFGNASRAVFASMTAYLLAQLLDVRLYHFWRDLTNGRHLWLRNNASTIFSQLADSALIVLVLFVGEKDVAWMAALVWDMWLFKLVVALCDTPFLYAGVALLQRWRPPPL